MSTPEKSFIAVDPNSGATYRFNETDWQEKKDRFVSKYPDAEIMEYDAYNPEETQQNDDIFVSTENGAYSFSPDEWAEKQERFMAKYPKASVGRVRAVNYWGDKAAEQEQAIKEKRQSMMSVPQNATELWGNNPDYLRNLNELEEMEKAYKENPYVQRKAEEEKSSLRKLKEATENDYAAFMKEYEDVIAAGGGGTMFHQGSEDAMMQGFARSVGAMRKGKDHFGRQVEYDMQKPLFDAAIQNISGAEDLLDKPNQSENNGNAVANVFKGIGAKYGSAEFWSRGMNKLVALNQGGNAAIEKINRKLQEGGENLTEDDIDNILSPAEKAYVFSLMEVANAQAQRAPIDTLPDYVNAERKVSKAYQIGEGIAEMTGFIAEFIATGNITDAATSGATKVVQGWLIKNLMAKGGKALAQKAARGLSKVAVNALTKTASAAMKSAVRTAAMGATGGLGGNIATQRTTLQEDGTFKGTGESILGGTYETAVENFTEEMGPVITDLLGAPFKPLAKPIKDYLKGIDYSDFGKLESMAKKVGYVFDKSTPMAKALAKGGYHGTVEEYGEELLGALIRGEMDEFFDKDQQLVLIGTFAPMAVLGMGGSAAHVIRSTKEVKAAAENLRLKLKESGIDDKQIDYLTDYVRSTSAEKMGKEFSPLIGRMAQESGLGQSFYTSDTYKAVARYIKAVAEYQTIDSQHKEQEGQQRADKQAELEEKYGKFYNQSDNSVNVVQLKDGRVVYQVTDFAENGEAGAVDIKDSKPITFRAEDVQTYTDKEGKTHNQESGKMSLDSYLSSEIMKRKESAQTARMREDRQRQINELTQSLPNSFDLGTEADPYSVAVKSHDANGVTVVDEKGNEMTLPWDKVGRLMNKPIKVLTDSELAEAEAAEMALKVEAVRAKNAKTSKEAQEVETDTAAIDEEVKSLQPNPEDLYTDKETGEVDEVEFWKNDPEGYCEWNDKRQQDGGIDSMKQIANARAALEGVIKKAEKEAKTDNPVTRRTAEGILFTAQQQLDKYAAIEQQYAERNSTQEEKRAEEVIAMRERASFWREKLNLGDNLVVLESLDEVKNPIARRAISLGRTEGWYDNKEGKVYLYLPDIASTRVLDKKVMHEIVTHYGLDHFLNESEYAKLTDMVWNIMSDTAKRNYYNYTGVSSIKDPTMRRRRAAEEFIAKVAEDVNFDNANAETKSIWQRILDFFKKLFEKDEVNLAANEIAEALNKNIKGLVVGNEKKVEEFKAQAAAQAQTHQETAQPEVSQSEVDTQVETILNESGISLMEDLAENVMAQAETMTNEDGMPITSNTYDGTELFSTTTAKPWTDNLGNEHKGTMEMVLERMQQMEFSEQEIRQMEAKMQTAYDYMMKLQSLTNPDGSVRFEEFNAWAEKTPLYKQVGRDFVKAITSLVSNGDYPINLELTTDCIKREAFTMLLNELVKRGADLAGMGPAEIVTIQKMMKQYGIQVACALCFVEGKRLQIVNWASQIVNDWNDALIEAGVETDEMFEFGKDGDAFIPSEEWRTYEDKPKLAKALRTIDEVARIFQGVDPKVYKAQKAKNEKALKKYIKEKEEAAAKKGKKWTPTDEQKREMKKIKVAGLTPTYVNENMKEYTAAFEQMRNEWVAKSPKKGPMRDPLDFTPTKTQWDELEKIRNRQIENVKQKMVRLIMEYPEMRKKMTLNDLLGSKGLMEIRQQHGVAYEQLYSIILQRFGTGTPKPVQDAVPYDGEVMTLTESAFKAANKIGGARLFSFSDFDITKVFDYMQMFFDLEANRQMLQSYTKEVAAILLFGKSNAKFNISTLASAVVPAEVLEEYENASEGKRKDMRHQWAENAGLLVDENGTITGINFSEEHSVSPEFAQQIFHDDSRNKDCGAIMVGASVNHAIYSAAQAWIRMVIPFHLSGMPIAARDKTDVKWWTDNTEYQSTRKKTKDGWSKISDKENTFEFYADMHQEGWNMRDKAREYLDWCKDNAFRPKFDWGINSDYYRAYCEENGYTPNQQIIDMMDADTTNGVWNQYYKFLTDFTAYKPVFNEEGEMIDEIPSPQQRVISNFDMSEMEKQVIFEGENSMLARREGNIALANQHVSELADKVTPYLNGQITEEEMGLRDDVFYDARKDANAYLEAKEGEGLLFSTSNNNQRIFVSNAAKAVEGIKQDKATPEQWLKMIEKNGGLKAGEDKWMGLSDFLKSSDKKTLTKQEVLDFINEHMIVIEETHYDAYAEERASDAHSNIVGVLQNKFNDYVAEYHEEHGYDDEYDDPASKYAIEKLREEMEDTFPYTIELVYGNEVYVTFDYEEEDEMVKWAEKTGVKYTPGMAPISSIRLDYTTDGLGNKHEIALTVPTIERWNYHDSTHFGDAGDGRAVAWVRFGDTWKFAEATEQGDQLLAYVNQLKEKYGIEEEVEITQFGNINLPDDLLMAISNEELYEFKRLEQASMSTTDKTEQRILVIDEIQSKRHQEGREKGYRSKDYWKRRTDYLAARTMHDGLYDEMKAKYGDDWINADTEGDVKRLVTEEEFARLVKANEEFDAAAAAYKGMQNAVPDAPFDKNWHELAMKRMLRYAAENGYDAIAWTKGEQQAERYGIGKVVSSVGYRRTDDGKRVRVNMRGGESLLFDIDVLGKVTEVHRDGGVVTKGMALSEIVGSDLAKQIQNYEGEVDERGDYNIKSEDFRIGGEGMKGFYDKMLPAFMNKYGKKWGIKVEDINLPNLEEAGQVMHSVPVTDEMKESVMEGQVMFSTTRSLAAEEAAVMFSTVLDPFKVAELESGKKVSAYRSVQIDDNGHIYSPMASRIQSSGRRNEAAQMREWDQSVENLDLVTRGEEYGKIYILDEDGGRTYVSYNPYGHCCVNSMMNDQFKRAWERDELYVMKVEAPESELTSGYKAEQAKDAVGIHKWKTGAVGRKLPESKRRQILLTRWMKNVQVMTWEEVAQDWIKTLKGEKINVPFNVVPRKILNMLTDAGVKIVAPEKGMENALSAYKEWKKDPKGYVGDTALPAHVAALNENKPSDPNGGIRFSTKSATFATMDSRGKSLTPGQQTFFANSKAVDKDGNLLVLYHGTPRAGFTEFESGWFTTSKEDAISYSGDRKGRLFDPNEEYVPETLTAGDFPLGYMTFDSEEDRAAFLAEHPTAESALSESEYENARMHAEDEEYDALTERKPELQEIWDAYREYERDHFVDTTIGDILNNPDAYTEDDLRRAILAYDSNAVFDYLDEINSVEERKSAMVDALNYMNEDAKENGSDGILDIMVATRVPRNGEGIKHNDTGNRTYEVYANIERPYEIDANGRGSEFVSGDIYKAVEDALTDEQYDGVIIRNWRVGRHQQLGDVVVPKNGSQVKLTSNENPTESNDILFSTRQPYESAKAFIQTETDKFYETYNTTATATVVYANSRKMVAEALGYSLETMPNEVYQRVREEANNSDAFMVTLQKTKEDGSIEEDRRILIFAKEYVNTSAKVDRVLFHENTHGIIPDKPELLNLGQWLLNNPVGLGVKVAEGVKETYEEVDWAEEMMCDYVGTMLSFGKGQEALDSVPEEYKPLLNYVYERFGYKPESEDPRRRSERLGDARELQMRNSENEGGNEGNSGYLFSTAGREKSVDEIVLDGKMKIASENKEAADAFMDRIRNINGNLQKLRMAAAAQREYDQKTVKTITDIANDLLEGGALTDLTRGEIKRLLSIINGGVGKSDLTKSVDRLMDLMVANQLRYGKNLIEKFLKIRGSKVDQRGVEVRGTLDIPGQQILNAFKEGIGLSKEKLADRIADAEDALSSDSETKKRNAENELVGFYLAKQYHEDINDSIEEEKDLRNEIKVADEDYKAGKITKEMHKQLLDTIYEAILENRIQRVNAYEKLASDLGAKMVSSIKNAGLLRDAEKERVQKIQHFANSDMQGMPADMHGVKENRFWNSPLVRFFLKPLATFDQMLRSFAPKSTSGEGYLWNHFMGGWTKATESEYKGVQKAHEMLDSAARTMFGEGVERWSDLFAKERKMPKITIKVWDNGEMVDKEISQGNALYIYMVNKMTDGKMKLRKMGISQEDVDAIVAQMDPRFITLADWMQERFLPSLRDKYNAVHERLFGAPMASIDNYFPIKVNPGARTREVDVEAGEGTAKPATITGSIIKRTKNSLALDIMNADAFDVMLEHIQQMEHWAAFAEFNKDLNTLLSYRKFRNRVENMSGIYGSGKTVWSNFKTVAEIAAGVYQPASKSDSLDKTALNVAKGVTGAKISFRVYTAIKQLLSMPAFVSDANIKILAKNIATPWIAWNWAMENLPMFEKRWKSRQAGDTRLMQTDSDWKVWKYKIVELAGRYGMTPNAFIDAVTVSIGARSIYETKYQSYLDMGYSEEQADKKAKQDATILFNESQQSNESAFLSAVQVDRTVASVAFTVFRNSAMGYQRMAVDAWRNISHMMRKGYKEESIEYMKKQMVRDGLTEEQAERAATRVYNRSFAKNAARLVTFQFLVQFAWNLGAYLPYLLVGDDDDEKKAMVKDAAIRGLVGGPIEGMAGGSIVSNMAGNLAMGEKLSDVNTTLLPVISDIEKTIKMLDYDKVAAYNEMFNILIQSGIGVNPQTFTDIIVAIEDACNGEPQTSKEVALCIMRALQVPQSQLEKVYFDEIDFTVDKGLDLTIEEFAKRYANYKVNRGTPLTGWMYKDEVEKEREDKYIKRFLETAEELKRSRGNEEAKKYYEYLDNDYKETTETLNELKRKAQDSAMKGEQMEAMEYAKMLTDFMETDLFKDYVKFGGKAKAIERIRDKMKKVDMQTRESLEERMLELRKDMVEEMEKANL